MPGIACPHCGARTIARDSNQLDPLTRNIRFECQDIDCGFIFLGQIAIYRTLRESLQPRADISRQVPLGQWAPERRHANDDQRVPVNDNQVPAAAEVPPLPG